MAAAADNNNKKPPDGGPPKKEAAKKLSVTRAEVLLLVVFVLLGMGLWLLSERGVTPLTRFFEPNEERTQLRYGVRSNQDALAMTEAEQKATQEQLIQTRLELYKQEAALGAFDAVPRSRERARESKPAPDASKQATASDASKDADKSSAPEGEQKKPTREDISERREEAARGVNSLIARLDELQKRADEQRAVLERSRSGAAREFGLLHAVYKLFKLVFTLVVALLLLRFIRRWMRPRVKTYEERARASGYEPNTELFRRALVAILSILIAYATFDMAGAAFAAAVVLLSFLARDMRWPDAAGDAKKTTKEEAAKRKEEQQQQNA